MDYNDVLLVAVIAAIVELLKVMGFKHKYLPVASVVLGILGGVVYLFPEDIKAGILMGLIMGLSAIGLYSGGKNVVEGMKEEDNE